MRHALLLSLWLWDPVILGCDGVPDHDAAVMRYVVTQLQTEPAGYRRDCAVDETGAEVCVENIVYYPVDVIAEVLVSETSSPQEAVAVPPLGGVTFVDIEAMDEAGNVSGGICE